VIGATDATQALIEVYCRELKLAGLRKNYPSVARDATSQGQSYLAFLGACLSQEIESRKANRLAEHLRTARFPILKTLEGFDFLALPSLPKPKVMALADGAFIRERENVILLGNPVTGKTHVAIGLGVAAIAAGYKVRFVSAVTLAQELLQAQSEYRLPRYLKSWAAFDLVILDELGYLGLGPGGPLLFQFCAERYERGSLAITTNLEFSRWVEVFGDATLTSALLDRLTHHSHVLLFQGQSRRFRESRERLSEIDGLALSGGPDVAPSDARLRPMPRAGEPPAGNHVTPL
jgi:DNA replication protein DnaC